MKIETMNTLIFTIASDNALHTTAVDFIRLAAKQARTECTYAACPMEEGAVDQRSTEFRITDSDAPNLRWLSGEIRAAMNLIGVLMSDEEKQS